MEFCYLLFYFFIFIKLLLLNVVVFSVWKSRPKCGKNKMLQNNRGLPSFQAWLFYSYLGPYSRLLFWQNGCRILDWTAQEVSPVNNVHPPRFTELSDFFDTNTVEIFKRMCRRLLVSLGAWLIWIRNFILSWFEVGPIYWIHCICC